MSNDAQASEPVAAVRGGTVVTPEGARPADVLLDGERIAAVVERGAGGVGAGRTVDATGCIVLPGSVDAHVHVHLPYVRHDGSVVWSADAFPQASIAAALGGTTTLIDFAMQEPGEDLVAPLERRLDELAASTVDVALHCWILDPNTEALQQLSELVARGVPSFKAFMAYSQLGTPMTDGELYELFEAVGAAGGLLALHAENAGLNAHRIRQALDAGRVELPDFPATRPAAGEEEAVSRGLIFAAAAGTPVYFVHLSSAGAVRRLAAARDAGQAAFGETCPHFLLFDDARYAGDRAGDFVMAPPLRSAADRSALWAAIDAGDIDVVATDHSAWPRELKSPGDGWPDAIHGVGGLGLLTPLMAAAAIREDGPSWETVARITAEAPARIFGLTPRKGAILPGADADLVVLDPQRVAPVSVVPPGWVVDNGIYAGQPALHPHIVLRRASVLVADGCYVGPERAGGEFVPGARTAASV